VNTKPTAINVISQHYAVIAGGTMKEPCTIEVIDLLTGKVVETLESAHDDMVDSILRIKEMPTMDDSEISL
jgi:hypothetical protein